MIGHTKELTDAVEAAAQRGLRVIETSDGSTLIPYFIRIEITKFIQTDSLLAIASQAYWNNTEVANYANDWSTPRLGPGHKL
jgi:hypothetical protein